MADELDQMLQGAEDQSQVSPAEGGQDATVQPLNQTPEEVEFNSLSGNTQERIRELIRQKNEALQNQQVAYVPPAPTTPDNPDVQEAVRKLNQVGIATKDDVNKTVEEKLNQIRWDQEMSRLEGSFNGQDGTPQFNRVEVEDYIRTHPQFMGYTPEDVFKFKMFPDDFMGARQPQTKRSSTLRPSKPAAPSAGLTVEEIADKTNFAKYGPAALEWQEEHKTEIDKVLGRMEQ